MEVIQAHLERPPPAMPAGLPHEVADLVLACLRKRVEERPTGALELVTTIRSIVQALVARQDATGQPVAGKS
jgi:hypothetical protein